LDWQRAAWKEPCFSGTLEHISVFFMFRFLLLWQVHLDFVFSTLSAKGVLLSLVHLIPWCVAKGMMWGLALCLL
jgi:hypothetical protein